MRAAAPVRWGHRLSEGQALRVLTEGLQCALCSSPAHQAQAQEPQAEPASTL